jgi:hypothetical protein
MSATQARVAVLGVLGLMLAAFAAVPVTAKGSARQITREAADPTSQLEGRLERARQRDEAAMARFLVADASARLERQWAAEAAERQAAQDAADRQARLDAKARADRGARTTTAAPTGNVWGRLAACESGGDPTSHSASGRYHGAFQFSLATWHSLGYDGNPADHSYATQLQAAQRLQARSGWLQWPSCARRLGLA